MSDRTPERIEMRTPAILSAAAHVAVLVAAIVNLDLFNRPPIEPEPVMVDFVAIAKHAAAPTIGNPPPQPKDAKVAKETTKAPPPKTADPPPAPEQPKPEVAEVKQPPKPVEQPKPEPPKPPDDVVALKPKEPEPPKVEKQPEPPKPEPPKPEVKKEPPKPPQPKPAPPTKQPVDSLIDDILKNKDTTQKIKTPEQQPKPVKEITRQAAAAPNLANVVTASEVEGVREKIRPCWNFPAGVRDQSSLIVTMVVQMNQDGTPTRVELSDRGRYNNDPTYRAAADSALRAVSNPRCQPWPLSPDKYNAWRTITFNFDPRDY